MEINSCLFRVFVCERLKLPSSELRWFNPFSRRTQDHIVDSTKLQKARHADPTGMEIVRRLLQEAHKPSDEYMS